MSALQGIRRPPDTAEDAATATRGLYERHGQRVLTFCISRLRNVDEAQDATQTTFLHVLRALGRGDRPRSEIAWLLGIATNVCYSTQRTLCRRNARTTYAEIDELEAAAEAIGGDNEEVIWLRGALERLPENQRKAILLREWQGLSYADMAAELDLSIPAIEALLFRARRTLSDQRFGSKRLRGMLDLASLGLVLRKLRNGAVAKAAAVGAGATLASAPFVVAHVAARRVTSAQPAQAAGLAVHAAGTNRTAPTHSRRLSPSRPRGGSVARASRGSAANDEPAVTPPRQDPPPQAQPPAGLELPPLPPLPIPALPPVVRDALAQLPPVPPVIAGAAGTLPATGS